jgi:hypothetical protein
MERNTMERTKLITIACLIASNDNWLDNVNWIDVRKNALSPKDQRESALVLHLPAGAYTAVVRGANGATGNALVEVYHLD